MEYQRKKIKMLHNTPNQLSKFTTKKWIEVSDQSRRVYNTLLLKLLLKLLNLLVDLKLQS